MKRHVFLVLRAAPWRANVCDPQVPYELVCRERLSGVVYWRSTGYGGYLPTPQGRLLPIDGLTALQLRHEVARINREFLATDASSDALVSQA